MAAKVLLSTFLLLWVGVCYGETNSGSGEDVLSNVCAGDCPEYELLCSTPEYDVRRYKSALWVSTTVSHLSLSQGSGRARKRIHDYFKGANDQRLKMSHAAPFVTQSREQSESPFREITVSMPLPKIKAKHLPKPTDPRVVIDLVPETIMYVKKFESRSPRVGFVADLEARNFFKTLTTNKEPFQGKADYYYVFQYGSSNQPYIEIAVFALNERIYKWLEFNDLAEQDQALPTCLRNHTGPMVWEKMDQSDIPLLTRERCSTTYCDAPSNCFKFETAEVKGIDDKSIHLRRLPGDVLITRYTPPTCYFDTAIDASASLLLEPIHKPDASTPKDAFTIMGTIIVEKREALDGENGCEKFFRASIPGGDGIPSLEDRETTKAKSGFLVPKTLKALHNGSSPSTFYQKCFGGNTYYEPSTIASTTKMLMNRLRESGLCFLGDHLAMYEYHPQSRLFDRHNEIILDADKDCRDQEGRPPLTFPLPLSKDYSRSELTPSLSDHPTAHKYSSTMRLANNLRMVTAEPVLDTYICSTSPSPSCSSREAFYKAINPLLSYLNGNNEDNMKVNLIRPLFAKANIAEATCTETGMVCTWADRPPTPIDDNVSVRGAGKETWFESVFKGDYGPAMDQHLDDMMAELDKLKPFGVQYNADYVWRSEHDDPDMDERLFSFFLYPEKDPRKNVEVEEEQSEEDLEEIVSLPKPEGCNDQFCPTVYVTKNHSSYLEVQFPKRSTVCHRVKLCGDPRTHGRQLFRPLMKYFIGYNSANESIRSFSTPYVKARVYSAEEEEKGIGPCEHEYQACIRLPDDYEGKEIPEPTGKGVSTYKTADGYTGYATTLYGTVHWSKLLDDMSNFRQTLDEENVPYDKNWVSFFTYRTSFNEPWNKAIYMFFVKETENIGQEETESKK